MRKDFIGFIEKLEEPGGKKLYAEFMKINDEGKLFKLFKREGLTGIPKDHCKDIIAAKERMSHPELLPDDPCGTKGY